MKTTKHLLSLGFAVAVAGSSWANSYTDIDQITGNNLITQGNNRIEGIFNIVTGDGDTITIGAPYHIPSETISDVAGFTPGSETVDSAFVTFYFRDDVDDKTESVRIGLDNFTITRSYGIENIGFSIFEGDAAGAIQALEIDGILKYNIIRVTGDFYFDYARLEVTAHVPDGGTTSVLFGMGILGLAALRRKLS